MKRPSTLFSGFLALAALLAACKKETATFNSDQPADYFSLQPGKYIIYDLDSIRFTNFGQADTVIHYQAKDLVDTLITDNLQRPSWRVIRYLRDAQSTSEADWKASMTYSIIPGNQSVEVVENNLRFLKVQLPITQGFTWHGNSYLPASPFESQYPFSNDEDIQFWDYDYAATRESVMVNDQTFDNTITISQVADSVNVPIEVPEMYAYRNHWTEQYAKGIGLIYREVSMWEYQPPNGPYPGYRVGFGINMRIREHN